MLQPFRVTFAVGAVLALAQFSPCRASALSVRVYNLAGLSDKELDRAMSIAADVFAKAEVDTEWQQCPASASEAHEVDFSAAAQETDRRRYLVVRLVRGMPKTFAPAALGFALPRARTGVHVTIFVDRIEALARSVSPSVARILGHAMAHEVGHVLLSNSEHTSAGLMKSHWSEREYRTLAVAILQFSPEQTEPLQRRAAVVKERSASD